MAAPRIQNVIKSIKGFIWNDTDKDLDAFDTTITPPISTNGPRRKGAIKPVGLYRYNETNNDWEGWDGSIN